MAQQKWQIAAEGGYLANPDLSRQLRYVAQPLMRFRTFVRAVDGFGRKKGDTLLFDRISNISPGGRKITELERMPAGSVTISQGMLKVDEYGNSIEYTGKLEDLAEFDVENIFLRALRDDAAKTLDREVGARFRQTKVKAIPTTTGTVFDEDGVPSTAANKNIDAGFLKDIVDEMKAKYLVPLYDGENYLAVVSVKAARALKDDPDFEEAAKYGDPERLFSGEIGRFYGVRFVEETNVLSNKLGTTNFSGEAVIFGDDAVVEGIVVPLEIRAKIPTDYGRDKGIAWYFLGGWALTWETANPGEVRVIHVTSA
jgi:N4-gp56 family major capsid protein